jgi:hypothetical protein
VVRIILHIGTHKTGTTSFQRWFRDNRERIAAVSGASIYDGVFRDSRELGALCIDADRETPGLHRRSVRGRLVDSPMPLRAAPEWETFATRVTGNLREQHRGASKVFVISSESLSLLRRPAELARLRDMLPAAETTVVVCLRSPADFLRSWTRHLDRDFFELSDDPNSFAYVEADSWLVDYPGLLSVWRDAFGEDAVHVVDYDRSVASHGSTIPALLAHVSPGSIDWPAWEGYVFNTAGGKAPRRPVRGVSSPRHWRRWWWWKARRAVRRGVRTVIAPARARWRRR